MEEQKIEMIEDQRYLRQKLLWGSEGQDRLNNARVSVVGLDHQGIYSALCLASLGIGNIVLVDGNEAKDNEKFIDMMLPKGPKAENLPNLLKKINKQVNIEGYVTNLESRIDQLALDRSDIIIDATNSIRSKQLSLEFGKEKSIPVFSTSSKQGYTKLVLANGNDLESLMTMFEGHEQNALMGLMMSGMITEEVRKVLFNDLKDVIKVPIRYKLGKGYRFGFFKKGDSSPVPDQAIYQNIKAAFFGGGALGNWGAIAGALMGFGRLDVIDYDTYESHNINRQVLAYDGIGKLKAEHIAEKIRKLSDGKTQSVGHNVMIEPGFTIDEKYDLIFDFVDNPYTRAINSGYAAERGIPLISAGALPYSSRWDVHIEGKTQCMGCLYNIYEEGRKAEMIRRASCAANPDPSVVMSNAIAAVGALLETYTVFEPEKFGQPFNGEQTYRADSPKRFGTAPLTGFCDCYSKPIPNLMITENQVEVFKTENPHLIRR